MKYKSFWAWIKFFRPKKDTKTPDGPEGFFYQLQVTWVIYFGIYIIRIFSDAIQKCIFILQILIRAVRLFDLTESNDSYLDV